jgi:uncharacterized protein YbjT (DUF2867 family)
MLMKIVIIGGSGLIGSKLAIRLRESGQEVVPASPSSGVDTLTGKGLAEAIEGAQVVVDVSNSQSFEETAATQFFETSTGNLLRAEAAAGVGHHVILSVVGADRMANVGYMRAKLVQEKMVKDSKIPYTILRATQFMEFIGAIAESGADGNNIRLTTALFQPVAADDVAAELAQLVVGPPLNATVDLAGPEKAPLAEFGARFLNAKSDSREVKADLLAGYFGAQVENDSLVPLDNRRIGSTHFHDWLLRTTAVK